MYENTEGPQSEVVVTFLDMKKVHVDVPDGRVTVRHTSSIQDLEVGQVCRIVGRATRYRVIGKDNASVDLSLEGFVRRYAGGLSGPVYVCHIETRGALTLLSRECGSDDLGPCG